MKPPNHGVAQGSGVTSPTSECSGHSEGVRSAVLVWSGKSSWGWQHLSKGLKTQALDLDWQREGRLCEPGGVGSTVADVPKVTKERGEAEGSVV